MQLLEQKMFLIYTFSGYVVNFYTFACYDSVL